MKVNKILAVDCYGEEDDFFIKWMEYLAPKHHLTKTEQRYLAACLRQRYQLSKSITDEELLDETTLNDTYRAKIKQELGMSTQQIQNIIAKLKKLKILIPRNHPFSERLSYYKISPSFIPDYDDSKEFLLLLVFKNGEGNTGASSKGIQPTEENNQ